MSPHQYSISISTNTQYQYQYQGRSVSSISTVQYQYAVSSTGNLGRQDYHAAVQALIVSCKGPAPSLVMVGGGREVHHAQEAASDHAVRVRATAEPNAPVKPRLPVLSY